MQSLQLCKIVNYLKCIPYPLKNKIERERLQSDLSFPWPGTKESKVI